MADPIAEGWITTDEAASLTGYDRAYIRRLAREGHIAASKVAQEWLIEQASLLAYKQQMDDLGTQRFNPRRKKPKSPAGGAPVSSS